MDLRAPERMHVARPSPLLFDRATFLFGILLAPVLGAALTALFAYHLEDALAWIAFVTIAPGTTLAFARRRRVSWSASWGYAVLALTVAACWIALAVVYMVWEIGNDWVSMPE